MAENSSAEPLGVSSSETKAVFSCPSLSILIWELDNTTSHHITIVVTSIACPAIVLLNLLVILAMKTRRELKKNSTMILLCSLAVADLLVGALSMPLSITLDALVLRKRLVKDIFCTIHNINALLMYTACFASFFHLLVIAWERYVAVLKWREFKAIATRGRLRKYAVIAWLATLLAVIPPNLLLFNGVHYAIILIVDVVVSLVFFLCLFFMGYFYVKVYRGICKRNRSQFRQVHALVKWKREVNVALTTFLLTVFAGVSVAPTFALFIIGKTFAPFLLTGSFLRWSELLLQMNSLLNPIFYCYRNHHLRKAVLELLRISRKPQRIQPIVRSAQLAQRRRHRDSVSSLDFGKYEEYRRLERSQSCSALHLVATRGAQLVYKRDKHCESVASRSSLESQKDCGPHLAVHVDKFYTVCGDPTQPVNQTVTVQMESAVRMNDKMMNEEL